MVAAEGRLFDRLERLDDRMHELEKGLNGQARWNIGNEKGFPNLE
jgi:uncharacterized protein YdcH (DUF465 family)